MISIFNVTDLNFISDGSDAESLRFLPSRYLKKNISDRELIKRIFTEDISVNPEPVIYPEVIQTLIDADAQTVADVAKILSLYNPADISEILQTLINANPQPSTAEAVMQSNNILGYPYESNSAIYDCTYKNWSKLGTGTITRTNSEYLFKNAGVRFTNLSSTIQTAGLEIDFEIKIPDPIYAGGQTVEDIIVLYNSLQTTSSKPAYYEFQIRRGTLRSEFFFRIHKLTTTNGTVETTDSNMYNINTAIQIEFKIYDDGTVQARIKNKSDTVWQRIAITSTNKFNPQNIMIGFGRSSTATTVKNNFSLSTLTITQSFNILSKWNP